MKLRLATYNCENLFSRAQVLRLADATRRAELMAEARTWQAWLARQARTGSRPAASRPGHDAAALARYLELPAPGALPGELRFRRSRIGTAHCEAKARVLRAVDADVQCLVEVEDRASLAAFNRRLLRGRYPYHLLLEGNDARAGHLGVLSRLPLAALRSHCFDRDAVGPIFSRDCLELELALPDDRTLHLLLNHFDGPDDGPA
ncbi:MAG TPA: hypothetical protein VLU41_07425, partial [Ideonella sp.]|nr:hypothetical protein [Ideonella sp.]